MTSAAPGARTSGAEVTNVSPQGLWLLLGEDEVFLPFEQFPWFKDAPIGKIMNVEMPPARHLRWPDLDIDLAVESVFFPDRFPLVSGARP